MKSKLVKNTFTLTMITLVFGLLLGLSYEVTKEPIAKSQEAAKQVAYRLVMAEADEFKGYDGFDVEEAEALLQKTQLDDNSIDEVAVASKGDEELGYVVIVTNSNGYGGEITLSVGIDRDGTVKGIQFLAITETAGLGMNATKPDFYKQFENQQVSAFTVTKQNESGEGKISAISGATITSDAVTEGVNAALTYFQNVLKGGN